MSDLIDRQAAIDAPVKMVSEGLDWIPVYHLKDLPSVEPETKQQATVSSDCIYRQQALEAIRNIKAITGTFDDEILLIDKAQAQTELMMLPSAQPERNKGKWIDSRDVCWLCSECGKWLDVLQGDVDMNFCPNCGADMRGEEE